jgi:hypothetical protein
MCHGIQGASTVFTLSTVEQSVVETAPVGWTSGCECRNLRWCTTTDREKVMQVWNDKEGLHNEAFSGVLSLSLFFICTMVNVIRTFFYRFRSVWMFPRVDTRNMRRTTHFDVTNKETKKKFFPSPCHYVLTYHLKLDRQVPLLWIWPVNKGRSLKESRAVERMESRSDLSDTLVNISNVNSTRNSWLDDIWGWRIDFISTWKLPPTKKRDHLVEIMKKTTQTEPGADFYERAYVDTIIYCIAGATSKQTWWHLTGGWLVAKHVKAAYLVPKSLSRRGLAYLFGAEEGIRRFLQIQLTIG